ncbi:KRAB-A domain-containing protein 2 [Trichinella spiralis]|uniref:KRAB-A domain-containing protein 2 n=1 Tax=Trichinella spiralis TaxID=6334 RepID=UPI0001EFD39F|nr:KRAB-A domain-containing protein 2 [Trichinella spiralis]
MTKFDELEHLKRCFPSLGMPIHVLVTVEKGNFFGDKKEMGQCHREKKNPKGLVLKPVGSSSIMSRGQVDFINFQTLPNGKFNHVMAYVVHFSKCFVLRLLREAKR